MRRARLLLAPAWIGLLAVATTWAQLPDRFTLGKYVPADSWMYVHVVANPERQWLEKEWQEVFDSLKASGVDRDIISAVMSALSAEDRAKAESTLEKWTGLLKAVKWRDLTSQEFVFAERMIPREPGQEYFLLVRGNPETAAANFSALAAILKELAALTPKLHLADRKLGSVEIWTMTFGDTPESMGFSFELFRKGEIIGVTTSDLAVRAVASLMEATSDSRALVSSPRFNEALSQVKRPEDSVAYFDIKLVLKDFRGLMARALREGRKPDSADGEVKTPTKPDEARVLDIILKAVDTCDLVDYVIETAETDGYRERTYTTVRLQPSKDKCPLAKCCFGRAPFEKFDQFIPKTATSFSLSGFVDLEGFYKLATDFVRTEVPDGPKYLEQWNATLAGIGFDPQRDLFDWWSGEMISVQLPAAVVTPMGGADWVQMIRVKNGELASKKVGALIDFANRKLQAEGQMLMITPAPVDGAEGFRQVTHPMLAMMLRPVVGVKGDWLVLGSSAEAVNQCFAVSSGKAPSIVENERFKKEGLIPKGPVVSASFADTSKFGQELGQAVGMAGMLGGMAASGIDGPDAAEKKQVLQRVMSVIMKLGPALQKLDFYSSEASMCTYDGTSTLRTEKVVTYKAPGNEDVKTTKVDRP